MRFAAALQEGKEKHARKQRILSSPICRIRTLHCGSGGLTPSFYGKRRHTNIKRKPNDNLDTLPFVRRQLSSGNGVLQILLRGRTDCPESERLSGKGSYAAVRAGQNPQLTTQEWEDRPFCVRLGAPRPNSNRGQLGSSLPARGIGPGSKGYF
jgi:hypothetical protein